MPTSVTRAEVEDLLYAEAALLDAWRLEDWLGLLTEDATYLVPSPDTPDGDPASTLFLVADDAARLRSRVEQLMGGRAWSESPPSRTRRLVGNVRILAIEGDGIRVTANFVVHRLRGEREVAYVGRYEHVLVRRDGGLRIRERRAILDQHSLRHLGKVSIIL